MPNAKLSADAVPFAETSAAPLAAAKEPTKSVAAPNVKLDQLPQQNGETAREIKLSADDAPTKNTTKNTAPAQKNKKKETPQ